MKFSDFGRSKICTDGIFCLMSLIYCFLDFNQVDNQISPATFYQSLLYQLLISKLSKSILKSIYIYSQEIDLMVGKVFIIDSMTQKKLL